MYARVLAVMPLLLSLAACQGAAVKPDYDLTHDFAGDQTWEWAEPRVEFRPSDDPRIGGELMAGRIEQAVAEQLDARGGGARARRDDQRLCLPFAPHAGLVRIRP